VHSLETIVALNERAAVKELTARQLPPPLPWPSFPWLALLAATVMAVAMSVLSSCGPVPSDPKPVVDPGPPFPKGPTVRLVGVVLDNGQVVGGLYR
jgi:hypothetical protein